MAGNPARAQPGLGFLHPVQPCDPTVVNSCETAPVDGKEHGYTFVVNGFDPLRQGNLSGMTDSLRELGFPQTYLKPFWRYRAAGRQIRAIRQSDPDAKVVLVGFSLGSLLARRLANDLDREGIALDRLVYVGGDYLGNTPQSWPSNVAQVVNIRGHGLIFSGYDLFFNGADIDNALNLRLDVRHIVLPSQAQTVESLASSMASLAQDSHAAIAARTLKETPVVAQPNTRTPEKSTPVVHPASPTP
jgi:pimeloyl-ACP methyl ester carboxylesterase